MSHEWEPGNQVIMKTVGGKALADVGYANSIGVGKAEALRAVLSDDSIWERMTVYLG
jgi:hypothetical protein